MQEWLLYSIFDSFCLFLDCFIEILSTLSELVKDEDMVIDTNFSFLLEFLNSCDDLSGKSSDFQFLVLSDVEQYDNSFSSNGFVLLDICVDKLLINDDIAFVKFIICNFNGTFFLEFFKLLRSQFSDCSFDFSKGFVTFKFGTKNWKVRKSL